MRTTFLATSGPRGANLAGDQIHLLIVVELQIDHTAFAEARGGDPVLASSAMS